MMTQEQLLKVIQECDNIVLGVRRGISASYQHKYYDYYCVNQETKTQYRITGSLATPNFPYDNKREAIKLHYGDNYKEPITSIFQQQPITVLMLV